MLAENTYNDYFCVGIVTLFMLHLVFGFCRLPCSRGSLFVFRMKNAFLGRFRRFPDSVDKLHVREIKTRHAQKSAKITFYRKNL